MNIGKIGTTGSSISSQEKLGILKSIRDKIEAFSKKKLNYANKDAVIVLGNSRCGKSTIVNFLIGKKLYSKMDASTLQTCVTLGDNPPSDKRSFAKIGHEAEGCTTKPSSYACELRRVKVNVWDTPGFGDSRSRCQNILNAYYISKLLHKIKSYKIVLLVTASDIFSDNIESFCRCLKIIMTMFPDYNNLFKSTAIIFTKVSDEVFKNAKKYTDSHPGDHITPIKAISNILEKKMKEDIKLGAWLGGKDKELRAKAFINNFVKNNQQIGIFKKAEYDKEFNDNALSYGILDAISNTKAFTVDDKTHIPIGLDDDSLNFLKDAYDELKEQRDCGEIDAIKEIYRQAIDESKKKVKEMIDHTGDYPSRLTKVKVEIANCKAVKQLISLLPVIEQEKSSFEILKHLTHIDKLFKKHLSSIEARHDLIEFFYPILKRAGIVNIDKNALDSATITAIHQIVTVAYNFVGFIHHTTCELSQEWKKELEDREKKGEQNLLDIEKQIESLDEALSSNTNLINILNHVLETTETVCRAGRTLGTFASWGMWGLELIAVGTHGSSGLFLRSFLKIANATTKTLTRLAKLASRNELFASYISNICKSWSKKHYDKKRLELESRRHKNMHIIEQIRHECAYLVKKNDNANYDAKINELIMRTNDIYFQTTTSELRNSLINRLTELKDLCENYCKSVDYSHKTSKESQKCGANKKTDQQATKENHKEAHPKPSSDYKNSQISRIAHMVGGAIFTLPINSFGKIVFNKLIDYFWEGRALKRRKQLLQSTRDLIRVKRELKPTLPRVPNSISLNPRIPHSANIPIVTQLQ